MNREKEFDSHTPTVAITPEAVEDREVPKTFGHYDQLELLGAGAMGSVSRVYYTRLQQVMRENKNLSRLAQQLMP